MESLTAARLLALSYWLLAFPAGLQALEKGDPWVNFDGKGVPRRSATEPVKWGRDKMQKRPLPLKWRKGTTARFLKDGWS
jgi:hypothetical protein